MIAATSRKVTAKSFELLEGLEKDNSKDWFDAHRDDVKSWLLGPFETMLEAVSEELSDSELPIKGGSSTMFRMNRDVRFSKDKRPYRESVAGLLTPSGTKAEAEGVVYVELNRSGGWAGGGFYKLATKDLNVIRDRIVHYPDVWSDTKAEIENRGGELARGESLKGMPRGYGDYADEPFADDLKLKSLLVRGDLPKPAWLDDTITKRVVGIALAIAPLIEFGQDAQNN